MPSFSATELAQRLGLTVQGDPEARVHGVATLARAGAGELGFLANPRYRSQLADSAAGAHFVVSLPQSIVEPAAEPRDPAVGPLPNRQHR